MHAAHALVDSPATAEQRVEIGRDWDALIETGYMLLAEAQCPHTGLIPNWWVPTHGDLTGAQATQARTQWAGWQPGAPTCSGSGTAAAEFGAEASRTLWRVALDALWYGSPHAVHFSRAVAAHAVPTLLRYQPPSEDSEVAPCTSAVACEGLRLATPPSCGIRSVLADWTAHPFMLAPIASSLMVPLAGAPPQQRAALEIAASLLQARSVDDYYDGSWLTIGTLTLSGALQAAGPLLASALSEPMSADEAAASPAQTEDRPPSLYTPVTPVEASAQRHSLPPWVPFLLAVFVLTSLALYRRASAAGDGRSVRASSSGGGCEILTNKLRRPRTAADEYERQPLSEGSGLAEGSELMAEPEWVMHYDRTGRPYWSDGKTSTWKKPHAYVAARGGYMSSPLRGAAL